MRKLFFLLLIFCVTEVEAQTYTSGLTATGSGGGTNVRLGGANPLLVNTTVDLGNYTFGFKKSSVNYFTILNNGYVGIGKSSPDAKLNVVGTFKLEDGSQGAGKVLTSDSNGLATWSQLAAIDTSKWSQTGIDIFSKNSGTVNIASTSSIASLTVGGSGIFTDGVFDENSSVRGLFMGRPSAAGMLESGRVMFSYGVPSQSWQIDNSNGDFRFFTPGVLHLILNQGRTTSSHPITVMGSGESYFQDRVGIGSLSSSSIDASALVHLTSTDKGLIIPRLNTTEMNAIASPANGLMIVNTDSSNRIFGFTGTAWKGYAFTDQAGSAATPTFQQVTTAGKTTIDTITVRSIISNNDALVNGLTIGKGLGNRASNSAIGVDALKLNTTGLENTAVGTNALDSNLTGSYNTAIGSNTLKNIGSGSSNTGVGAYSLWSNISGYYNTAVGSSSLPYNTTGYWNTALGGASLYYNTTGNNNSAVGKSALQSNTSGIHNVAMGASALVQNTAGTYNTAVGSKAMFNTQSDFNTAVGHGAMYGQISGSRNTALGYQALYYTPWYGGAAASNTVAVGYHTLYDVNAGSGNTAVGYNTGLGLISGNNNTIVGGNVTGLAAGLNNNIIIADGGGNRRINVDSIGNVGVGTNAPTEKLEVVGTIKATGLTIPTGASNGYVWTANASGVGSWQSGGGGTGTGWSLTGNAGTNPATSFIGTTDNVGLSFRTNNTNKLIIDPNGNVGIGTNQIADTEYKLFVEKGIRTRKVKVDALVWADYVFDNDYKLPTLQEVDKFIQQNKHLSGVPSAAEVEKDGIDLGDNQVILLKKVEELTLYVIELNKNAIELNKKLVQQQNEINSLKKK